VLNNAVALAFVHTPFDNRWVVPLSYSPRSRILSTRQAGEAAKMTKTPVRTNTQFWALPAMFSAHLFDQGRKVRLGAGQALFLVGDPGDGCYWVDEGLLKVHVVSHSGSDRILAILGAGTIVGELSMFDGAPRSASVTAIRASNLSFVSRAAFVATLNAHPEVYRELAIILARRLRLIDDAMAATSFLTLKGRAARALLTLADAFGHDIGDGRIVIRQRVTQSDIAAMAGIVRENFSRVMHDWVDRSLVSRAAGYYCLEKKSVLEHESEF
jgi:CRP/FNR family transcriptional regulator, cyclic AMP receptor protein